MSMDVEIETAHALLAVRPPHGRPVTFEVRLRSVKIGASSWSRSRADRYVVGLKGSDGDGFSTHVSFEAACRAALRRARTYHAAYERPRGVAASRKVAA